MDRPGDGRRGSMAMRPQGGPIFRACLARDRTLIDPKGSAMHSESQLRRRACAEGSTRIKYREASRWYPQYGPYALADQANCLAAYGLSLDDIERELGGG
jgi:hypothetical protein